MKRLISVIYNDWYPFTNLGYTDFLCTRDPDDIKPGDTIIVWGGADIPVQYYNRGRSRYSGAPAEPGWRDKIEWECMQRARELGCTIIGVCRGAQMLCALAGGYLIQHVNNHGGQHHIVTPEGQQLLVNSIHHQMMMPGDAKHVLLGHVPQPLSSVYWDAEDELHEIDMEREYIYFPEVKGHAIQWHPEMMREASEATRYVHQKIKELS